MSRSTRTLPLKTTIAGVAVAGALITGVALTATSLVAKETPPPLNAQIPAFDINQGFSSLVLKVKPAVVNVSTSSTVRIPGFNGGQHFNGPGADEFEEFFRRFFERQMPDQGPMPRERRSRAVGSGFVIDPNGLVVTNHHVIDDAEEIEVILSDGKRLPAKVKGFDKKTDLALLEVETDRPLPYVTFGDSDQAHVGDWVVAIGNPFGLGGTTTMGIISARGRDIQSGPLDDYIQVDAPINRGNSGGPLFNTRGEVIGVNTAIYSPNGGSVGIGFAIPSVMAKNVIEQLKTKGTVERGWLGVQIQTVGDDIAASLGLSDARGALVSQVIENSPASKAGLKTGDVILTYDGKEVKKMQDLPKLVALTPSGKSVQLQVWRDEKTVTLPVTIGSSGEEPARLAEAGSIGAGTGKLGLALAPISDEARQKFNLGKEVEGVLITDVDPKSEAALKGLRPGDVIKKVGKEKTATPADVVKAVGKAREQKRESALFLIERDGQVMFVALPLKQ